MKSTSEQMKFTKEGKMIVDSHFRGSEKVRSRRKNKEDAKKNGLCKQLTDEEYEREKVEIEFHLELLRELLHRNKKDQRHGQTMRKKMKWQRLQEKRNQQVNMQLTEELRNLEQMMSERLGCEELIEAELEMEVSICGPEQGEILGEEDNEKDLMEYWNSS